MPTETRRYALLEAPSSLGLEPHGVERLPERLLELGLEFRTNAHRAGRVAPPPYTPHRDETTRTLNAHALATWSPRLADAVESILSRDEFPIVLGGDCSILLGSALALRRRGRYGLFYVDGHADFYQPEVNPNGEAASMDLAFATGFGPPLLTDLEGRMPLVRPEDAVAYAFRDADEQRRFGSQPLPGELRAFDLAFVRRVGALEAARSAVELLARDTLHGFFIHLDADSLSDTVMPAVDYRLPDGLTPDELEITLRTAIASGAAVGLEVTIYNPSLDPDGTAGRVLLDVLTRALGTAAPVRR